MILNRQWSVFWRAAALGTGSTGDQQLVAGKITALIGKLQNREKATLKSFRMNDRLCKGCSGRAVGHI